MPFWLVLDLRFHPQSRASALMKKKHGLEHVHHVSLIFTRLSQDYSFIAKLPVPH